MFSNSKLCNHNIAKHMFSLQSQKNKKIAVIFFKELKMLNHKFNEQNLAGR